MKYMPNDIFLANGHDISNYIARHGAANLQIQAVMKLDGRVDYDNLSKAVRLSLDEEPVLGCRFIEGEPPYWRRMNNIDQTAFCFFENTGNPDEAVQEFLESPLDMDRDPMVKVKLIHSEASDIICLKINHVCCDGAGTKEYIQLLSKIYSSINQNSGDYIPQPRTGGRKDQDKLFDALGIEEPEEKWNPLLNTPRTMWVFPWRLGWAGAASFVVCSLPYGYLDAMAAYGKRMGATINDLILTAYYRAMFEYSRPPYGIPMDITSTIDLRRYLPNRKAEAIRNFSGGFVTRIARIKGESFEGTLLRVMHKMNKIKSGLPGLQNAIGGEYIEKLSFEQINDYYKASSEFNKIVRQFPGLGSYLCLPGLSNLGFISKSPIRFGNSTVTDAYILPPAIRPPGFLLLACSYNGVITLATSFYKDSLRKKDAEKLLNKIKDELVDNCVLSNDKGDKNGY
ncbi:MAG: condensation domain-containing protein [Acetivibrionales bacterium]|jgi:NRPS condensation-like uncharacterized protein